MRRATLFVFGSTSTTAPCEANPTQMPFAETDAPSASGGNTPASPPSSMTSVTSKVSGSRRRTRGPSPPSLPLVTHQLPNATGATPSNAGKPVGNGLASAIVASMVGIADQSGSEVEAEADGD